jgi:hypothetical protein
MTITATFTDSSHHYELVDWRLSINFHQQQKCLEQQHGQVCRYEITTSIISPERTRYPKQITVRRPAVGLFQAAIRDP